MIEDRREGCTEKEQIAPKPLQISDVQTTTITAGVRAILLPFGGHLLSDNRWVQLAKIIPWGEIEKKYSKHFAESGMGALAKSVRVALGALIIKERMKLSDE